jgi:hypothetical protein
MTKSGGIVSGITAKFSGSAVHMKRNGRFRRGGRHIVAAPNGELWLACSGVGKIARVRIRRLSS